MGCHSSPSPNSKAPMPTRIFGSKTMQFWVFVYGEVGEGRRLNPKNPKKCGASGFERGLRKASEALGITYRAPLAEKGVDCLGFRV